MSDGFDADVVVGGSVAVAVGIPVGVPVAVGECVLLGVSVIVAVRVAVGMGVSLGVSVIVGVLVAVGMGVLQRAVGDRGGEATTLTNIGAAWSDLGEKQKALGSFEQALPLVRAVGDRRREAATLTNIGAAWWSLGEQRKALEYFEQALPLVRAMGNRGGEATALANIGAAWSDLGEQRKALECFEQALPLGRAVGDRGGEATTCHNISVVYHVLGNLDMAIEYLERCVELYEQIAHPNLESDRRMLERLKRERDGDVEPSAITPEDVNVLAGNSVAVKTGVPDRLDEWRASLRDLRADFARRGPDWDIEAAFADALLTVLDDQPAELPESNPYAPVVRQVVEAIEAYKRGDNP